MSPAYSSSRKHDHELEAAMVRLESRLVDVLGVLLDLVVAAAKNELGEV